jgi:hypothetical protein
MALSCFKQRRVWTFLINLIQSVNEYLSVVSYQTTCNVFATLLAVKY